LRRRHPKDANRFAVPHPAAALALFEALSPPSPISQSLLSLDLDDEEAETYA
jgi:hypothetical protein